MIGGFDGYNRLNRVARYDPRDGQWQSRLRARAGVQDGMHISRSHFGVQELDDNSVLVCGGFDGRRWVACALPTLLCTTLFHETLHPAS